MKLFWDKARGFTWDDGKILWQEKIKETKLDLKFFY